MEMIGDSGVCTVARTAPDGSGNVTTFLLIIEPCGLSPAESYGATLTIQPTPKRSATMPKRGDQKVLPIGICTWPPWDRAANLRSASASFDVVSEREKPL